MWRFIAHRVVYTALTLAAVSLVSFLIIQLPPGDFLTSLAGKMAEQGGDLDSASLAGLKARYGLDQPWYIQYWRWITGILLHGDFGQSFEWNKPVSELLWDRMGMTLLLSLVTLIVTWMLALPIGIYSAVRRYSLLDYVVTFLGFIGLAIPSFLLSLALMYILSRYAGMSVGGLFSPAYVNAPWSWAKLVDLAAHLWLPVLILSTSGTAALIRVMRANLIDELHKPYVQTARANGLGEMELLFKYPVRVALNPFVSTIGWVLPHLFSGAVIVSVVLSLPTAGPLLLSALLAQDMYLAGSFILILSALTVIGTLLSDLLLAWLDPRVRYQ
ncbi:ABC transporter permease [Chelatococcus asaccharovorans]|uniref:Peptide/nickel transport system permease protein n=1 Tax=Chelatococcus asaccharovorans TaxID=28210 RepID=A0A2V3TY80_9HYPH|nr:ABC transporter permease [Chelatococcus asaccharovorans]MBS7706833.1 ABC transporter permease [Chelatococcus asaccharovorans]PXW54021.1 peptide/nickel transport system permease protein [Chelatococcus asaccharovorans]CAH1648641.1 Peptide/nickel transport system permease protein [Chelatococcus asaccharovorans]CAH1690890.1 Peptide/nickel transport system permease protein [Chelatococcus asaccharovorans]